MNHKYKIGAIARQFGVTTQALRFYEKKGLFPSAKGEGDTTRSYHARNFKWLSDIRRYHLMGFKTEDIKRISNCSSLDEITEMMVDQRKATQNEIDRLKLRAQSIDIQLDKLSLIDQFLFKCEEVTSPELLMLINQEGQELDHSDEMFRQIQQWNQYMPFIYNASVVYREALLNEDKTYLRKSGYCIDVSIAEKLKLPVGSTVKLYPSRRCIYTISILEGHDMSATKLFSHAINYLKEHELTIDSDIFGRCITVINNNQRKNPDFIPLKVYYEYWIPIKQH